MYKHSKIASEVVVADEAERGEGGQQAGEKAQIRILTHR